MIVRGAILAAMLALPAVAQAQAYECAIPSKVQRVRPDLPSAEQPRRVLPIGGYTLAITWAPQYCHDHAREASARFQCKAGNRFGFTLHGLWPDGRGAEWPQYCKATALVPQPVIRRTLCSTPSAQLIQHEWAKHGTCMAGYDPARFFRTSTAMYRRLRYPDMQALSRTPLTAGKLAAALARANPGLRADGMRITANRQGWLDEIWLCLDTRMRYQRCPAHQGGLAPNARVKVWRGVR
ncbi:Ribonuclease T [Sphingomonas sp. EC-HK361]|nr:Ribonuclease T [Sphingomonas sp. EC-HK361]